MSAIFGEVLTFGQGRYPDVQLRVRGDEFYASYETLDGYAAVSDRDSAGLGSLSPLSGLVGQGILGTWSLRIADLAAEDVGKLNKWALEITPS
jgi:hypothetical protein